MAGGSAYHAQMTQCWLAAQNGGVGRDLDAKRGARARMLQIAEAANEAGGK